MLLSVTVCFILIYRQVIVSFFASVKIGVSIQLVPIATFSSLLETLMFEECFVQFNLNVTPVTLLNFGGTAQKEIRDLFPVFL